MVLTFETPQHHPCPSTRDYIFTLYSWALQVWRETEMATVKAVGLLKRAPNLESRELNICLVIFLPQLYNHEQATISLSLFAPS